MKKSVRMVAIALVLVMALTFFACDKKTEEVQTDEQVSAASAQDLLGTWKGTGGEISTVSFSKDGSYMDNAGDGLYISGKYTVDENAQTVTVNEDEYGMVFVYHFTISGNNLSLQLDGGKQRNFVKQVQ